MSKDCSAVCTCTPGRLVDPLGLTPFPVANFPPAGDDNRFSVLLGDDGNLYVSNGVQWNAVGGGSVVPGEVYQAFQVSVQNQSGTLNHKIIGLNATGSLPSQLVDGINGASGTFTPTPTGTDSSTPFAAGAKISSAASQILILDTVVAQDTGLCAMQGVVPQSDTGDVLQVLPLIQSRDVNGVTLARLELQFRIASSGAFFGLNTTNIANGQFVTVALSGFMKV